MTSSLILIKVEADINLIYLFRPFFLLKVLERASRQPWTVRKVLENRRVPAGLKS